MQCSDTRFRETPIRAESLRVLVVGLRCTISRMPSCSSMFCLRALSDETWALGKRTAFTQCIEHLVKHSTIRNSAHRKPSTVFFNSSSGTTIAEAINIHHISVFGICEDLRHFSQHTNNVTINSHNSQLTLQMLQTVAQHGGREGQYWAPKSNHYSMQSNACISETFQNDRWRVDWSVILDDRMTGQNYLDFLQN